MSDKRMALLVDGPRAGEWVEASKGGVRVLDPMEPPGLTFSAEAAESIEIPLPRIRDYRIEPVVLGDYEVWVAVSEHLPARERQKSILCALLQRDVFVRLERYR